MTLTDITTTKESLAPVFERTQAVQAAYLFGSQADGSAGAQSDIDLAVVLEEGTEEQFRLRESVELELALGAALGTHNLDLVVLNRAPLPLRHRALATGKVLYSRDEVKRTDFVEQVTREYIDVEPWLRRVEREHLATLQERYCPSVREHPVEGT